MGSMKLGQVVGNFKISYLIRFINSESTFSNENWVGNMIYISIFETCNQNIPNWMTLSKKINNNLWSYLVSKIVFHRVYEKGILFKWFIVKAKKTGPWNGHSSVIFPSLKPDGISKDGTNNICTSWKSKHFLFFAQGGGAKIEPAMPSWKLKFDWP